MSKLLPLADDTIGPYFPPCFAGPETLNLRSPYSGLNVHALGQAITIVGSLVDKFNKLTGDCSLIDVWQADSHGVFRRPVGTDQPGGDPFFEGFGRIVTFDGKFNVHTVKPGGVVSGETVRAPHITLNFFCDGFARLVTQFFFEGEPANEKDPLLLSLPADIRQRLIMKEIKGEAGSPPVYELKVKFRGEDETPFFDDLLS